MRFVRESIRRLAAASAIFLLLPVSGFAERSPLWSDLKPGPHAVGFKVIRTYDYSRVVKPKYGEDGKLNDAERARPLLISIWYPAKKPAVGAPMTFERYIYAGDTKEASAELTDEEKQDARKSLKSFFERPINFPYGEIPDDRWNRLMKTETAAIENAEAEAGPFPLIVGSSSILGLSIMNEYLASHCYIVAFVTSLAGVRQHGVLQTESSARDIEYLTGFMRGFQSVDRNRLAAIGFSGGGFAPYLMAMRNTDLDALVTIESAIFVDDYSESLKPSPHYDAAKLTAPLFHAFRRKLSEESENLKGFESHTHSKRYRFLLNDANLLHQDFGAYGMASAAVLDLRGKDREAARRAFELTCRYVLHFFNAHVKKDSASLEFLNQKPEKNGAPEGFATVEVKEALKPPPR